MPLDIRSSSAARSVHWCRKPRSVTMRRKSERGSVMAGYSVSAMIRQGRSVTTIAVPPTIRYGWRLRLVVMAGRYGCVFGGEGCGRRHGTGDRADERDLA